jgi:hypothetical protein
MRAAAVVGPWPMTEQECLIYVSTAAFELATADVANILVKSERLNQIEGVSGILLYAEGNFMQCIEGPAAGVSRTYARIQGSSQHHSIIELLRGPSRQRQFSAWDWACAVQGVQTFSSQRAETYLAQASAPAGTTAPATEQKILGEFWSGTAGSGRCWCLN